MKIVVASIISVLSLAAAASDKICFGTEDRKGERFAAQLDQQSLTIIPQTQLGNADAGTFENTGHVVKSQSGLKYLEFNGGASGECGVLTYLVDENLLASAAQGKIKVRCKSNTETYFCHDNH